MVSPSKQAEPKLPNSLGLNGSGERNLDPGVMPIGKRFGIPRGVSMPNGIAAIQLLPGIHWSLIAQLAFPQHPGARPAALFRVAEMTRVEAIRASSQLRCTYGWHVGAGVSRATFACPELTTFCRLDGLGLEVTGQWLSRAGRCWFAGSPTPTIYAVEAWLAAPWRRLAHEPAGLAATVLQVTIAAGPFIATAIPGWPL